MTEEAKTAIPETTMQGVVAASSAVNKRALKAVVIPINKAAGMATNLPDDPFASFGGAQKIIEPPFDPLVLSMLEEQNTELRPLIETMETNVDGFGHIFVPRLTIDEKDTDPDAVMLRSAVRRERVHLENFFTYASIEDGFIGLRRKTRRDVEATGNGYWEVIRSASGKIQYFAHIPSYQMRLTALEEDPHLVDWPILELQEDNSVKITTISRYKRFRRFVQSRFIGNPNGISGSSASTSGPFVRWFKEFGDPRTYDNRTGELVSDDAKLEEKYRANEIIHFALYCPRSPYGLPRYIGQLLSIFGDRAAEEINFVTFRNNNVPSMFICIANGQLTQGSVNRLTDFASDNVSGSDNYSKFIVLEAEGQYEGEDANNVKIDIKPLVSEQHKDALFQNYSKANRDKIRGAFRIPPIYLGATEDYTRATSDTAKKSTDEQVFAPERNDFDARMNRLLFPHMGVVYHLFRSNSPNTTDNAELTKILSGAEKTGGMTPRIARSALEGILGRELPSFPAGFDPDVPFSLTMANAVKNMADPTEPGQQVTAMKVFKALGLLSDNEPEAEREAEELVGELVQLRERIEKSWRRKMAALEATEE